MERASFLNRIIGSIVLAILTFHLLAAGGLALNGRYTSRYYLWLLMIVAGIFFIVSRKRFAHAFALRNRPRQPVSRTQAVRLVGALAGFLLLSAMLYPRMYAADIEHTYKTHKQDFQTVAAMRSRLVAEATCSPVYFRRGRTSLWANCDSIEDLPIPQGARDTLLAAMHSLNLRGIHIDAENTTFTFDGTAELELIISESDELPANSLPLDSQVYISRQ